MVAHILGLLNNRQMWPFGLFIPFDASVQHPEDDLLLQRPQVTDHHRGRPVFYSRPCHWCTTVTAVESVTRR